MPGATIRLTLKRDGSAALACSAQEMGMGTATVQAQHAADRLGLPVEAVTFELGDSALPASPFAGGSSQTARSPARWRRPPKSSRPNCCGLQATTPRSQG
ncbi:molybdopterin cofactor-binding domain-containing protein [Chenggangzhangella methanolivorans]|uniref:molybdopterin cofactor-binding domain-containing protein n=1 Tax=Chenggangzhangella methanolivorans TaxID=1437009 RepID=UPI0021BDA526|nr:molybdopterin cofactor-binding domain-containing protein [Chenggangzhangella methanolivorans]